MAQEGLEGHQKGEDGHGEGHGIHGDLEQGDQSRSSEQGRASDRRSERRISRASIREDYANLDEYGKLVKYVSTYREPGAGQDMEEDEMLKRMWYAPWKKKRVRIRRIEVGGQQFPDEWLLTDIREGLSTEEVATRRQRSGWNELVSEKENPLAKIMGYFKGPILYGKSSGLKLGIC